MGNARGFGTTTPGIRGWQELQISSAKTPQEAQALSFRFQKQREQDQADQYVRVGALVALLRWIFKDR